MKYMLLLFDQEMTEAPPPEAMEPWNVFQKEAATVATMESGAALQPGASATVVSVRDGKTITTDGPFIDTKEQLVGYYTYDCENLDVAIDLAAKIPLAPTGHVEVRPVMEIG